VSPQIPFLPFLENIHLFAWLKQENINTVSAGIQWGKMYEECEERAMKI